MWGFLSSYTSSFCKDCGMNVGYESIQISIHQENWKKIYIPSTCSFFRDLWSDRISKSLGGNEVLYSFHVDAFLMWNEKSENVYRNTIRNKLCWTHRQCNDFVKQHDGGHVKVKNKILWKDDWRSICMTSRTWCWFTSL